MTLRDEVLAPRTQLPDDVAAHLRDLIMSGQVRAGEYLRLEQLAQRLGTSVTPVREALLALRGEGFVVLQPHRGFVVSPLTRQDVADVFLVQSQLAGELAARACRLMSEDAITGLASAQLEIDAAHERGDLTGVDRLNHHFHRSINRSANAPKLALFLSSATRYVPRLRFTEIAGWSQASVQDHPAVLQALRDRDAEAARAAMVGHVTRSGEFLIEHLDARGVWSEQD